MKVGSGLRALSRPTGREALNHYRREGELVVSVCVWATLTQWHGGSEVVDL